MATPDDLINDARNYAITVTAAGTSALQAAMAMVDQIGRGYIAAPGPKVDIRPPYLDNPGPPPEYEGPHFEAEEFDGQSPTLENVGTLSLPPGPGNVPSIPQYIDPQQYRPTGTADTSLLNGVPVINTDIDIPPAPVIDVQGIPKPVLVDLEIPPLPTYREPEFVAVRPVFDAEMPTDLDELMRDEFSTISPIMRDAVNTQLDVFLDRYFPNFRSAMAKIEERLDTYLNGGTALTPVIENAIYNRTLDKVNVEANRASAKAWDAAAKAGFTMPSAMLLAQQVDIDQARRDNSARAATEIAVKQAELEQNNLQFAVTQSINLRQVAMTAGMAYYSGLIQLNGQAIEYARSIVDAVVKAFDIATKYAEVQTRIYESEARVYEARLRGALAVFEAYNAQIRGIEAQVNVDRAKVDLYRALLDGARAEADVYRAQVDAVLAQVGVEKAKVDLYGAKVQAFVAQVNGYSAQWNGYVAAVSGERAKIEAAGEQVRAFAAAVQAYEAEVRARATELEARASLNNQKISVYRSQVEAYSALINAEATGINVELSTYKAQLDTFMANINAEAEYNRAAVAQYEVALRGLQEAARLQFQYMAHRESTDVAKANAAGTVAGAIGSIYARTAQAALAGMNSLAATTQTTTE